MPVRSGSGSVELFDSSRDFPEATGPETPRQEAGPLATAWRFSRARRDSAPYLLIGADQELVIRIDTAIASRSVGLDG
ncbi:MAG: hypothetical protein WD739_11180 [Actinomycetota bacterium]